MGPFLKKKIIISIRGTEFSCFFLKKKKTKVEKDLRKISKSSWRTKATEATWVYEKLLFSYKIGAASSFNKIVLILGQL